MSNNRFPPGVSKRGYARIVDGLGVYAVAAVLRELRPQYIVLSNQVPTNDVDIWVHQDTKLLLVIEVKNWSRKSHPVDTEATNTRKIFKKYEAKKLLITSHHFGVFDDLERDEIAILELGFTLLPRGWYEYYGGLEEGERAGMDYFNDRTEELIKTKLEKYLLKENM